MKCEFEEKTYELYHNLELLGRNKNIFTPGLVFEKSIGIDVSLFSQNRSFWGLFGTPLGGKRLGQSFWNDFGKKIDGGKFPRFKFNIFIQYKRAEWLSKGIRRYHAWKTPFFRWHITPHQQNKLEELEKRLANDAVVVYAAPAFYRFKELLGAYSNSKVIDNSNYVKPSQISTHKTWTYTNSGILGRGFSEPTEINSVSLLDEISKLNQKSNALETNSSFILHLSKELVEIVKKDRFLGEIHEAIKSPEHELGKAFFNIYLFLLIANANWVVGVENSVD